ncbi:hypothetical protein [Salinimicrobium sp. TH3]|uniref:hypothetical protein n=1 Tax=Salinimicrobium sp. TH3 TaxID=2997342 RepID=UPI0022724BAC|nr:hypothetical protein [Salinimicrobium sp. TH3]MCY2688304.1 hypothetical protein [Salinimicrobium sp. TH3]
MKKIFDFYINSSIHVALAVVSLCLVTVLYYEAELNIFLLFFLFFGAVSGYNFVKYAGVAGLHHRSLARELKNIQVFSIFCFTGLVFTVFFIDLKILLWSAIFGALTLLYALPVFSKKRNLRSISGIKVFIIAFVWAGVTVILPVLGVKNAILDDLLLEFLQRFLLVVVWILPFEIRDLKYDLEQLGTIPQRVGVTPTKILGIIVLAVVVMVEFIKGAATLETKLVLGIIAVVTAIFVWKTKENQSRYFASFWVEGIPVLWLMLLLLIRNL